MTVYTCNITKDLEKIGFKQAEFTHIWVHPNNEVCYEVVPIRKRYWALTKLTVHKTLLYPYVVTTEEKSISIHRLKALAFLSLDEFKDRLPMGYTLKDIKKAKLVVNHKDGNKFNSDLDNLEWTTYRGNIIHAFKNKLRTDNIQVICHDVIEDKEITAYSINQLGKKLGIHPDYICRYLKSKRNSLLAHRYMVKNVGEEYPYKLSIKDVWNSKILGITATSVEDVETGEIKQYPTMLEASKAMGLTWASKKSYKPDMNYFFIKRYKVTAILDPETIFKIKTEYDSVRDAWVKTIRKDRSPLEVKVTDVLGEIKIYKSLVEAAKELGGTKSALKAIIYKFNGKWRGYKLEYMRPAKVKVLDPILPELLEGAQKSST